MSLAIQPKNLFKKMVEFDAGSIKEAEGRYLRVVLLEDGETIHNAFFDRSFKL
jgi:hypothetical protein